MAQYAGDACTPSCAYLSPQAISSWRYQLTFPDGSTHELTPVGVTGLQSTPDGYYNVVPNGQIQSCQGQTTGTPGTFLVSGGTGPLQFYTTDGTYAHVYFDVTAPGSEAPPSSWHIIFKDGSSVYVTPGSQQIVSRNGVSTTIQATAGTNPDNSVTTAVTITDSVGRAIHLNTNSQTDQDTITASGYNGAGLTWTVAWASLTSSAQYQTYDSWDGTPPANGTPPQIPVVTSIQFPSQTGGLGYAFHYGETSESLSMTTSLSSILQCIQVTNGGSTSSVSVRRNHLEVDA